MIGLKYGKFSNINSFIASSQITVSQTLHVNTSLRHETLINILQWQRVAQKIEESQKIEASFGTLVTNGNAIWNSFSALARRPTSSSYLSDKDEEDAFSPWTESWLLPAHQLSPFMTSLAPARSLAPSCHPHVLHSAPSLGPFRPLVSPNPFSFLKLGAGLENLKLGCGSLLEMP